MMCPSETGLHFSPLAATGLATDRPPGELALEKIRGISNLKLVSWIAKSEAAGSVDQRPRRGPPGRALSC
jgi:hypothetical protein